MDAMKRVLDGAIDLHCHSGPSPMPRRFDHVEAARHAQEAGMRAIVVKSHHHSTVMDLLAMKPLLREVKTEVLGGIALNNHVGGLNPHAVDMCLKMGGRLVWFPTFSSGQHIEHHRADPNLKFPSTSVPLLASEEVDIFGEDGDLRPEVHTIIDLVKEAGGVIASGHLAPDRILALMETAHAAGLDRLVVNHPNFVVDADREQVVKFADLGATIEHSLCMYDEDSFNFWGIDVLVDWIELVGPERTSLGSDLGQVGHPLPVESYRKICGRLLDAGITEKAVRMMIRDNPARLLGIK
jgi:Family of unknown function (DUF6282)